jgi:uncharacterized RDD family membrane protein YckC
LRSIDNLKIDTPEQIELELPLAGIGSRFLALAFDTLLQFVLGFVALLLMVGLVAIAPRMHLPVRLSENIVAALIILFFFCLYWGYFAFFEIIWKGQTPGKRHAGIRVIKDTGRSLNAYEAIGRNLLRAVDGLPGMYGVGIVTMMLNNQHRRLGDYVAGTVVVHDKELHEFRPDWGLNDATKNETAPSEAIKISADELVLIETYLHRRWDLDPTVRTTSCMKIVELLKAKAGLEPQSGQSDDDFLESIVQYVRDGARFR